MKRPHVRFRGQRGQIAALVAIMIPVLLGFGGLSIDVGHWYQVSRKAQATADAAALTAARYLPYYPAEMTAPAIASAATNMPEMDQPLEVSPAYCDANDSTCDPSLPKDVKVTVRTHASTFLAKIFGFNEINVAKTAVATRAEKMVPAAIVVGAVGSCSKNGIKWSGSNTTVDGAIISNGDLEVPGNGNTATGASFHDGCKVNADAGSLSPIPVGDPETEPWPVVFSRSNFHCDFTSLPAGLKDGGTIPPGTYCTSGTFSISKKNITATNVTLVASKIAISGSGSNFSPHENGVIFYADGNGNAFQSPGSAGSWNGTIYVPNGQAQLPGHGTTAFNGLIEALSLQIPGSDWTIKGDPSNPLVPIGVVKLIK